jgi:hypothetical protein
MLYSGDIRPESRSGRYPHIVVYRPFTETFEAWHADGSVKRCGFTTYDDCVAWILGTS